MCDAPYLKTHENVRITYPRLLRGGEARLSCRTALQHNDLQKSKYLLLLLFLTSTYSVNENSASVLSVAL